MPLPYKKHHPAELANFSQSVPHLRRGARYWFRAAYGRSAASRAAPPRSFCLRHRQAAVSPHAPAPPLRRARANKWPRAKSGVARRHPAECRAVWRGHRAGQPTSALAVEPLAAIAPQAHLPCSPATYRDATRMSRATCSSRRGAPFQIRSAARS
eukprot:scaffold158828_cov32-Tisochrysis_lutea.AAC.1